MKYIETKIDDIGDEAFQSMVTELCDCVQLGRDQFKNRPMSFLLMSIGRKRRALQRKYLATDGILTGKVDKLSPDSVLYAVFRELAEMKKTNIEFFDGKTLLSVINERHKIFCPVPERPKRKTRRQNDVQFQTDLIRRRRANGDY